MPEICDRHHDLLSFCLLFLLLLSDATAFCRYLNLPWKWNTDLELYNGVFLVAAFFGLCYFCERRKKTRKNIRINFEIILFCLNKAMFSKDFLPTFIIKP